MRKDKSSESILEKASEIFNLPGEVMGLPKITITGCRHVYIENHKGILEYGSSEISVNGGKVILRVIGEELELRSMNAGEMLITGRIGTLHFEV